MRRLMTTFALVGVFVYAQFAQAAMSSTNYQIRWDALSTGGSDTSSSSSYFLRDSVSGSATGDSSSTNYQVEAGYRAGVYDQVISFDLYIQNTSGPHELSSLSGTTATMATTSGLSVGDYVAILQNRGASQVSAFGKITSLTSTTAVLDRMATNGTTPTVDGSNDYLYALTGSALSLVPVETTSVASGILAFEVTADNNNGYVIQAYEDANPTQGSYTVASVSDGEVTAGNEEYGARSSDTSLAGSSFDTQDAALTTSAQDIVTKGAFAYSDRSFLTVKLGVSSQTPSATYQNSITIIASGNF
ncbi:hypothetical protein HZA85_01945 [Candidatus Uhrbacteria bacterium]|nr:hypothetical protein [Candidatus Uhrbacteria bacterium]